MKASGGFCPICQVVFSLHGERLIRQNSRIVIRNLPCYIASIFSVKNVWLPGLTGTQLVPCAGCSGYYLPVVLIKLYYRAKVSEDPSWRDGATSQFIQLF